MDYNYHKIEPVFNYYLSNGFKHSLQELAHAVNITKKTLFNRYVSKENLELCVVDFWQVKSCERMAQRMEFANHAVEKLLMFLFELQYCRNSEQHFFQKYKELFLGNFEQNSPFITQLETIFETGVEERLFRFEGDPKVFAYFFQFNTLFILLNDNIVNTDYISFLFEPILTDFGKVVFKDIDIEQVFAL
jgi:AcrR family transcriptional regulator